MEIHYFQAFYSIEYEQPDIEDLHVVIGVVIVNENWENFKSPSKTNTVLQYDESYSEVVNWEASALSSEPSKRRKFNLPKPTMKQEIDKYWPGIDFYKNVRLVFTMPATEAASIHCINKLKELNLTTGATCLVVDCSGGTVDLTVRKLLSDDRIAETTERTGDFCSGTYVDDEFLKVLENRVSKFAMRMLKEKYYDQINYMIHKYFCPEIEILFTSKRSEFKDIELDIEKKCPVLKQYITGPERYKLEEEKWIIDLDFDTIKSFFNPVVAKILRLIREQLSKCSNCSVLFLVGGFGESKYLQSRIQETFENQVTVA
ncbi:42791_t:CDS:2, partial [Gigaspora margarita]